MSSGTIDTSQNRQLFLWADELDHSQYTMVSYDLQSILDGEQTAIAIAMEQSAATVHLPGFGIKDDIGKYTARVKSVKKMKNRDISQVEHFDLNTEVYRFSKNPDINSFRICIAFPNKLLMNRPSQWLNVLIGEIPRLGFITSLSIERIEFTGQSFPGPRFGVPGLRTLLNVETSPILCRSTRPAVGLDVEEMKKINTTVLSNGFHIVKDDELQAWPDMETYKKHVVEMVSARKAAEDATGEKKLYIANLICEPWELIEKIDIARTAGVDALLVAPAIQGLSILTMVRNQIDVPLLSHNTFSEMLTRHPQWRIEPAQFVKLQRLLGADLVVTPGNFATPWSKRKGNSTIVAAAKDSVEEVAPSMLIIQGGKNPLELPGYIEAAQGLDFMLIVASWVDGHPDGLGEAARIFRNAVDSASLT